LVSRNGHYAALYAKQVEATRSEAAQPKEKANANDASANAEPPSPAPEKAKVKANCDESPAGEVVATPLLPADQLEELWKIQESLEAVTCDQVVDPLQLQSISVGLSNWLTRYTHTAATTNINNMRSKDLYDTAPPAQVAMRKMRKVARAIIATKAMQRRRSTQVATLKRGSSLKPAGSDATATPPVVPPTALVRRGSEPAAVGKSWAT